MADLRDAARQALEACPFCGDEPSFSGNASDWKDESRYVELSLGCCVSMTEQIGWRRARDMTHEAKTAELQNRLRLKWNTRAALEQPEQAKPSASWPSGIDIADELDALLPISMGYSTRAAIETWWRDLVQRKLAPTRSQRMAEAGFSETAQAAAERTQYEHTLALQQQSYEREIKIEVEAEREGCAKVCEDIGNTWALDCAAAIRARGQA